MELRQLRYYKAVAELLNFSRAAEQLHVAQSALSRQIQALEHEMRVKLLDRDRAHVSLTDAGRAFYGQVGKLLLHVDVAVTEAQQIARGSAGELVVCTDWRLNTQVITSAVEEFRRKHPRVELNLRGAGYAEQIAMLRSGQAQLGFLAREYVGKKLELTFLSIQRIYINVILPARHALAKRKLVRLADLAKETWVDLSEKEADGFRRFFIQQCRLSGYMPRIGKTATSIDALFGLVASGYGVTAVPDHIQPPSGLMLRSVRTDCPPIESGAVWREGTPSPVLQHFIGILRQQILTTGSQGVDDADADGKTA